jgi:hypothetical protein
MGFLGALIGGGTSLLGGILGASAASKAAQQQLNAENNAANYVKGNAAQALGNIGQNLQAQQGLLSPYQQAGSGALANLSSLLGTPGQGLLQGWNQSFQAPTEAQAAATPGYQFAVDQATQQLQNSAAGRGGLLTGGTAKALDQYTQGLADTNYQQVYNNQFQNYLQNYQQFQQNQANQYNRLSGLAGIGQWAAGTGVGALGQASGLESSVLGQSGQSVANLYGQAGGAQASGTVGAANAWNSALGGIGNAAQNYALLSSLNGQPSNNAWAGQFGNLTPSQVSGAMIGPAGVPYNVPFNTGGYGPVG